MLALSLVALDSTVLATAIPTIVAELGGSALFPWLFSGYLLAQAVTTPVFAKLSDTFGRKPVILVGIALFMTGSVLCAFAWSMPALIAARVVQGLGAGAVQPMSVTIVGDIYTLAERARVQGYFASVWAVASVIGPTFGGLFAQWGIWRGVFVFNVPLCLIAAWMLLRRYSDHFDRRKARVDYAGAALLTSGLSLVVLAILAGGQAWSWTSGPSIGSLASGAVLLVVFWVVSRRAAEPILPAFVLTRRLLLTTTVVGLGVGAILIGLTSFIPTYLEGTVGAAPVQAGLAMTALTIGWPLTASLAGRIYLRVGFKRTALVGATVVLVGVIGLLAAVNHPDVILVACLCFVTGCGLGLLALPCLIAAQSSVGAEDRGVATGAHMFARSLGSAVGVAAFGAMANSVFQGNDIHGLGAATVQAGTALVFAGVIAVAVVSAAAVVAMPTTPPGR
ncbi:MFS transporter [Mycolicibacterium sp. BiH015]|uniref:MFS transporter n=1 Tax=Mycolicibacterium sp. BiH015 TaxID=3018808 RepID=UPI003FA5F595